MKRFLGAALVGWCVAAVAPTQAGEPEARSIIDKAIKALGGEEKLAKAGMATWKGQTSMTFNDNTNQFKTKVTVKGLNHFRSELDGEFNGNSMKGVTVLAGDKAWRKFGENLNEMEGDALATQKRMVYLQVTPITLLPLKGPGFKLDSAPEEKVAGKPAAVVKVTGPDGKDFKLFFEGETGLPVKLTATVVGFGGNEYSQETTFSDYKDFGGIKKATKVESKRDGERYIEQEITGFEVLDQVAPDSFDEPK